QESPFLKALCLWEENGLWKMQISCRVSGITGMVYSHSPTGWQLIREYRSAPGLLLTTCCLFFTCVGHSPQNRFERFSAERKAFSNRPRKFAAQNAVAAHDSAGRGQRLLRVIRGVLEKDLFRRQTASNDLSRPPPHGAPMDRPTRTSAECEDP